MIAKWHTAGERSRESWWKRTPVHLLVIVAMVTALLLRVLYKEHQVAGAWGFALDDAWIHAAVARNLVEGYGYAINPGEIMPASTSPAWTLLLSVLYAVTRNIVFSGKALGYASALGAALLGYHVVRRLSNSGLLGLLAATILTVNPLVVWGLVSGMEVPLVVLAVLAVTGAHYLLPPDRMLRMWCEPIALAFAAAVRPELFLLAPIALLDTLLVRRHQGERRPWKVVAIQCLIYGVFVAPYFAFNMITIHHLLPATYYAKTQVRGVGLWGHGWGGAWTHLNAILFDMPYLEYRSILSAFMNQSPLLVLLAPVGILAFGRSTGLPAGGRGWLLPLAATLLPLGMGVLTPSSAYVNYAFRYFAPYLPMMAVFACLGLLVLGHTAGMRKTVVVCAILLLAPYAERLQRTVAQLADDVHNTQALYVEAGRWLHDHIEDSEVLAVNDIGGVAYFGGHRILDVMGLASPEIWPVLAGKRGQDRERALAGYLQERGIGYFFSSPHYYPSITSDRTAMEPVAEWHAPHASQRSISPQVLYENVKRPASVPTPPSNGRQQKDLHS